MPVIQSKHMPTITTRGTVFYNEENFHEHEYANFHECYSADEMISLTKPFYVPEYPDRKFLTFDTETFSTGINDNSLPQNVVRRWVGSGKKANPQDLPFCLSISDGDYSYVLYDDLNNRYASIKKFCAWLSEQNWDLVAHNVKFDMHMLQNAGIILKGHLHDTVVLSKLADNDRFSYRLVDMVKQYGITEFEYMVDAYKKQHKIVDYRGIPKRLMTQYTCADTYNAAALFKNEVASVAMQEMLPLYNQEMEDTVVFYDMERIGMKIDPTYEKPIKGLLETQASEAESAIYEETGYMFNINSSAQLYQAMCSLGHQKLIPIKEETGNPILDKGVLATLEDEGVTIVEKILSYRKAEKLLSTYAYGLYDQRDANNRVHCNINQTEARTGRTSITKPALQTLPKRGDKRIRKAFVPAEGARLLFMDLDQVEYRLFAHYAKAEELIEMIKKGYDVHAACAALIFKKDIKDVTEAERDKAKTLNFALIYGQGIKRTAKSLKLTMDEARTFKSLYFKAIPEAKPFLNNVTKLVELRGYMINWYGRHCSVPKKEAYKGANYLIQGCAADYAKSKMIRLYKFLKSNNCKSRLLNFVHDELVIELWPEDEHLIPQMRACFSDFTTFRVPITAGCDFGALSWGEKEGYEVGTATLTEEEWAEIDSFNVFEGGYGQC